MLLAAGLATAGLAFLLLPVVLAFTGARRREDGGLDVSAQAAVLAGLLGVRLLRRDPAWELVPVLAGRAVGPRVRLGADEGGPAPPEDPPEAAPARQQEPGGGPKDGERPAEAGLLDRLRSQWPLARPLMGTLRALPTAFRLRRLRLDAVVGLADPEATGRLCGLAHALASTAPRRVDLSLTPDFANPGVHGRAEVRLHLRLHRLLYLGGRLGLTSGRVWAAARTRSWWNSVCPGPGAGWKGSR